MAGVCVYVHEDQLSPGIGILRDLEPGTARILLVRSRQAARALPFHKQRIAFVWAAQEHFAAELRALGHEVDLRDVDDRAAALAAQVTEQAPERLVAMETAEWGRAAAVADTARALGLAVYLQPNSMFISSEEEFARHVRGKKSVVLEGWYRKLRRRTGLLMDGDEPEGGQWNYDKENRKKPPRGHVFPDVPCYPPDAVTRGAIERVAEDFPEHFGELTDFGWPVTRADAEDFLADFLDHRLDLFGPYQDAMVAGERTLYHSLLSPLLNIGLLDPLEVCRCAEERYRVGQARLNSVEGFIRQILGWREYVYHVYRWRMPGYLEVNHYEADLDLPAFYWDAETDMACVREAVLALREEGVNHHIQRLMVTGNFALLAGIEPRQVNAWYWLAYLDAWEWVVSPNVLGMALHADGGLLATKPYAASAAYINRMSDHCRGCRYDPRQRTRSDACPFNALYWDFLARHKAELRRNPRMGLAIRNLEKREDLGGLRERAAALLAALRRGERI